MADIQGEAIPGADIQAGIQEETIPGADTRAAGIQEAAEIEIRMGTAGRRAVRENRVLMGSRCWSGSAERRVAGYSR